MKEEVRIIELKEEIDRLDILIDRHNKMGTFIMTPKYNRRRSDLINEYNKLTNNNFPN